MVRYVFRKGSQPVQSPLRNMWMPLKTARYRGIAPICLRLRVRKVATEAPFQRPVSEGLFFGVSFFCLVYRLPRGDGCVPANRRAASMAGLQAEGQQERHLTKFASSSIRSEAALPQSDKRKAMLRSQGVASRRQLRISKHAGRAS